MQQAVKCCFFSMWTQVLLFEKPMFQGECIEIEKDIYNFDEGEEEKNEEDETESPDSTRRKRLSSVGSLKILSGLWVHFFTVQLHCRILFFCFGLKVWKDSQTINMSPNYCRSTHTLISWCFIAFSWIQQWFLLLFIYSWVGYSAPGFEGRQYLLEEGEYADFSDWGGLEDRFLSIRPVLAVCIRRLNQRVQD